MKMTAAIFSVLTAIAGCGGGAAPAPSDRIVGDWLFQNADGSAGSALALKPTGAYSIGLIRVLSSSSVDLEEETGSYSATDSIISMTPSMSSCPGQHAAYVVTYKFVGSALVLTDSGVIVSFTPDTPGASGNIVATFGCFQSDGSFSSSPLAPVSS